MLVLWGIVFLSGFLVGALTLAALEGLGLMLVLKRLNRKSAKLEAQILSSSNQQGTDPRQSLESSYSKEGVVWVLESDKVPKIRLLEKVPGEQKRKKEYVEVSPTRKYAKIKDCFLILKESDGSQTAISLKGCKVDAVSSTDLSSRKWAKRFPIRVENRTEVIYNGSKIFYVYLETSWEKESWCKSLRLASCDKQRIIWFTKWQNEFNSYVASLKTGNLPFRRLTAGLNGEPLDRENRLDGSSSKVRLFLKKLARRASKSGVENKGTWVSSYGHEERKTSEKLNLVQDSVLATTLTKSGSTAKTPKISSAQENTEFSSSTFPHFGSQGNLSSISDPETDANLNFDEGTCCLNLLISRLFFDVKSSSEVKNSMKARIQRTLSNMRTPSYIGGVVCTNVDPGNLPPYIHGMRVYPTDMNEAWAIEVDLEYSGGTILDVETRVEVRELDLQNGDVSSDLLEGFEQLGKQLNPSEGTIDAEEHKNEVNTDFDGLPTSTCGSRWKSILNSVAKQVSQVPLSLSIQVASLQGTMRIYIKPPPSDQLWFGFTSMPNIELDLESSVGEHKITSGRVASFLINKFKAAIQETLVLPNCENLSIPWMLAETDNWAPRKVAPFMWLNQEAVSDSTTHEAFTVESETSNKTGRATSTDQDESKHKKGNNVDCLQQRTVDSSDESGSSLSSTERGSKSLELKTPLLAGDRTEETYKDSMGETPESRSSSSLISSEKQDYIIEQDDSQTKKIGRKARMLDLGKKMGEKLGEKRRHLEEKSRNIVEKMRGP